MSKELENFENRIRTIRKITSLAIKKRAAYSEFQGLEEELQNLQKALLDSYEKSKSIKHPKDKGDTREEILRYLLSNHGLIPRKYAVAENKVRVVSPSGHISPEIDIVLHDFLETIVLKRHGKTLDYLPLESVYGTIQVKSKLTKKALLDGLDNIAKFKSLNPIHPLISNLGAFETSQPLHRRFGILFAFEYALKWEKAYELIDQFIKSNPNHLWPNLIVILDKGHFKIGTKERYLWQQEDLEDIDSPILHSFGDQTGNCLLNFYIILMDLLKKSLVGIPDIDHYTRMPLTAGKFSYSFSHGQFSEIENCEKHGSFLRTISENSIERILSVIETEEPINWVKAMDLAVGKLGNNQKAYDRQPGVVFIYNPDNLPLNEILAKEDHSLTYESVQIERKTVLLPWAYIIRDELINDCPQCQKNKI